MEGTSREGAWRWLGATVLAVAGVAAAHAWRDGVEAGAAGLAAVCLALWLLEVVPPFVPTLLLLAAAPLAVDAPPREVLGWLGDPVLALFLGGFALGDAAAVHGIDQRVVAGSLRAAGGRAARLVAIVLAVTAFLSMWISNVAAAALMLAALRPVLTDKLARPLLVAVALGANVGGMTTPIGSGPNAIAIAAMSPDRPVTFVVWVGLALPLTIGALAAAFVMIVARYGVRGGVEAPAARVYPPDARPGAVALVACAAIAAWLTEPLHGVPSALVSVGAAATLFATGLLPPGRLANLDWSTLLLVGGGIGVGELLARAGLLSSLAATLGAAAAPRAVLLGALLGVAALLSAVMSNTATATLLIPLSVALFPEVPGAPMLVALAASFGMPFVISTPPNAMAVGAGARPADLFAPGAALMVAGCLVLTLSGPRVLGWFGL